MSDLKRLPGPAAALEAHLGLLSSRNRDLAYFNAASRPSGGRVAYQIPKMKSMMQWLRFASTYSRPAVMWDNQEQKIVDEWHADPRNALIDGRTLAEREVLFSEEGEIEEPIWRTGVMMAQTEFDLIRDAQTHYVSEEMLALVSEAAELAAPEPVYETDLPGDSGIFFLEKPLIWTDLHPDTGECIEGLMPVRAIGWHKTSIAARGTGKPSPGFVIIAYTTVDDYNAHYVPMVQQFYDHPIMNADPKTVADVMFPIEFHPWGFGVNWETAPGRSMENASEGKLVEGVSFMRRWVFSIFRIMWQSIVKPETWTPNRQMVRQLDRRYIRPASQRTLNVIQLRRFVEVPEGRITNEEAAAWPYPYRIGVHPFWRRQYYPR